MLRFSFLTTVFVMTMFVFSFLSRLFAQPESTVQSPDWSYDKAIYEVNLRQFTPSGTINEFKEHLPRLKELGADILWLMPIHPIGELNRKGKMGSYYSVKDYFDVDPNLGTKEDFAELVKEIHSLGMYVIIDWVANHTAWDNKWTVEFPDFYKKDAAGNFIPPVADWSDVIALDYNNKKLWEKMTEALEYWVKEFDIDGYRCDVAEMVPIEFWNSLRPELEKFKPVFMLAEAESPGLHFHAFDMSYSWELHHLLERIVKKEKDAAVILNELEKEAKHYPSNSFRMRFTTNHDENSWNGTEFEKFGNGADAMAVLSATIPGMFLIYSGQEAGNSRRLSFFEKDEIDWKESKYFDFYKKLFSFKKENPALWNGDKGGKFKYVLPSDGKSIFSFIREKDDNKIFVVLNLSDKKQNIEFNSQEIAGTYYELFSSDKLNIEEEFIVNLEPWGYKVFVQQ